MGTRDAKELEAKFKDDGYTPVIMYAQDDADEQASQVSDMTEEGISAMVIAPVRCIWLQVKNLKLQKRLRFR